MGNLWKYVVIGGIFLGAGSAAGVTLAPRASSPGPQCPCEAAATGDKETGSTLASDRAGQQSAQLRAPAAAVGNRVPNLRPPTPPAQVRWDERRPVERKDLPVAVEAVVAKVTQGRSVQEFKLQRRLRDGQQVFDAEIDLDGVENELTIDEQGKVLESERDMAVSELPPGIPTAIQTALPGAILMEAEHHTKDATAFYEIELRFDRHRHKLYMAEDGQILRHKSK
jgi:hypothetical protein